MADAHTHTHTHTHLTMSAGLKELMQKCSNLHPDKVYTTKKGNAFLEGVSENHQYLTSIDLAYCEDVTDMGLALLITKCHDLQPDDVLSFAKGDKFLSEVADHRPDISSIDLTDCYNVTDKGLAKLMQKCKNLHPNDVISGEKGDFFLSAVAEHQPHLTNIDLIDCPVTDAGLAEVMVKCKDMHPNAVKSYAKGDIFLTACANHHNDITVINLKGCKAVTDDGLGKLMNACTRLKPFLLICHPMIRGASFFAAVAKNHKGDVITNRLGCVDEGHIGVK